MWSHIYVGFVAVLGLIECTHIVSLDEDFNVVRNDKDVAKHVGEILKRLKTFKVLVHPRIRLFYMLLKNGISDHAYKTSDSLFKPNKYNMQENKQL